MIQTSLPNRNGLTEKKAGAAGGTDGGRDAEGVWDGQVHTAVFKMWPNTAPLKNAGNSAQFCVAAWMGGESGGEGMHVYVWLRPFAAQRAPETTTTLLIGYTPLQNETFNLKNLVFKIKAVLKNLAADFHKQQ